MNKQELLLLKQLIAERFEGTIPRYLDFACGTGRITSIVEKMALQSYGVDVSLTMVEEARRRCSKTEFHIADLTRTNLDIAPVNLITAFRFFGNAQDDLRAEVLRSLHPILREGGYLVLNNHRNPSAPLNRSAGKPKDAPEMDLTLSKLDRLLKESGFKIARVYGVALWILHHRIARSRIVSSRVANFLEPISRIGQAARICPDMVILAQKE